MSFTISAGNAKRLSGRTPEKWFSRLTLSALQSHRRGFTGFLTPVLGFTPPDKAISTVVDANVPERMKKLKPVVEDLVQEITVVASLELEEGNRKRMA
ncbi:hypothetical protein PTI98_007213 [Pleurotus ostreatus]|uniref:Uncharacterized protein n=1 Tax=Pleurotus ostreatus (strain PC15) TaxID=1137138 RepID=A0A067NCZ0_PLEO1|nr:hypothetical protein PTI98_010535 [Pleurotus ostreatus]KDQ21992.1 hypothetical protein PLEOSDRAFT_1110105 [Pleurotus ostreatus PC15]KAJ8694370.1 hypothetical protein PTI98_009294 [Pleurotus ostreatus]KAJ8694383.1 hypothetical protein PTI98_009307 [Pleurotus ostreatus]KAJ8694539.1 hypothetical protein PTI98_007203 [Pleurotus ostreatus]